MDESKIVCLDLFQIVNYYVKMSQDFLDRQQSMQATSIQPLIRTKVADPGEVDPDPTLKKIRSIFDGFISGSDFLF